MTPEDAEHICKALEAGADASRLAAQRPSLNRANGQILLDGWYDVAAIHEALDRHGSGRSVHPEAEQKGLLRGAFIARSGEKITFRDDGEITRETPPTLAQEIASIINSAHAEAPDEPIVEVMRVGDCYRARYVREERAALPEALAEIERLRAENAALRGWERTRSDTEPSKPRSAT